MLSSGQASNSIKNIRYFLVYLTDWIKNQYSFYKKDTKGNMEGFKLKKLAKIAALLLIMTFSAKGLIGQVIVTSPAIITDEDEVLITFNASQGGGGLAGYTGDVYAHTGVIIEGNSTWQHVIGSWGNNTNQPKLTRIAPDTYTLLISPSIREFYNVPSGEVIKKLAFVFRASAGSPQTEDLFIDVFENSLSVLLTSPPKDQNFADLNQSIVVSANSLFSNQLSLYVNNELIAQTSENTISHTLVTDAYGIYRIRAEATNGTETKKDSTYLFVRPDVPVAELPAGLIEGINYLGPNTAALVLADPPALKEYAFVIGDFNNWEVNNDSYMNRTPDGKYFWITLDGLNPETEYAFQYYIDGELKLADPYTHKVLDPWNDKYISNSTYPNLKPYPESKTSGVVSVLHTGKPVYEWQTTNFIAPDNDKLVIYELHIRDFLETRDVKTLMDTLDYLQDLGVSAIELMPINEFEGNDSWGYNPAFYFATDKAYGTENDYKAFIDECHRRGIAVIIDMVLNHSYGLSPLVQMYFDPSAGEYGQPSADNPWYNEVCPHEPYCWGYDFNHQSTYTRAFIDRVNAYWLQEFKVDGFRFDFTKGFTNRPGGSTQGSAYDNTRVANLKRMADKIWETNPEAYVILEHFADNTEEKELSNYGMMLWGNLNHAYCQLSMGYMSQSDIKWGSYIQRGWDNAHLVSYMESHDEERMMFKNLTYGNSNLLNGYDIKDEVIGLARNELAANFFITIPGPKMIWQFGELGYDVSIDDPCRVCAKPLKWDYMNNAERMKLRQVYIELIRLKKENTVFQTDNFQIIGTSALRQLIFDHTDNKAVILGNFGLEADSIDAVFPQTGWWHEFYTRDSIQIKSDNKKINLQPGEYRIYSLKMFHQHSLPILPVTKPGADTKVIAYPNPSSNGITFELPIMNEDDFLLEIYDIQGRLVRSLTKGKLDYGYYRVYWDTRDQEGQKLSKGLYFYLFNHNDKTDKGKIILIN